MSVAVPNSSCDRPGVPDRKLWWVKLAAGPTDCLLRQGVELRWGQRGCQV